MYTAHHKKQYKRLHWQRFSWFSFLILGLLLVQLVYNFQLTGNMKVLAYATDVNTQDLLNLTNNERTASGLGALSLNSLLNQAAQAKAEHMIAHNYWSHIAPDGTTPWYFIDQSGYTYINAGENLAYGFLTSSGAVKGWMDSPGHKANILGDYRDVGFGYANGASYQGGENTVIVAMYGTPQFASAPAQTSTPVTPAPTTASPAPQPTPSPVPVTEEPAPAPVSPNEQDKPVAQMANNQPVSPAPALNAADKPERTSLLSSMLSGRAEWPLTASSLIITVASIGFALTHIKLIRHGWDNGLKYVLAHPLTDAAAVGSIAVLFITATSGHIW